MEEKLKKILHSFLIDNYKPKNDVYLEMLLTHLSDKKQKQLLHANFIVEWIDKCVKTLEENYESLDHRVIAFTLRLTALVTENEWTLIQFRERRFADRIWNLVQNNRALLTPSVKYGHVRLLQVKAKYSLGLGWIKTSKAWKSLTDYCQEDLTAFVTKESRQLIYDILYEFSVKGNDDEFCLEILSEIMKPILENVFDETTNLVQVDDFNVQKKMSPSLKLLAFILQKTIESEHKSKIALLLNTNFKLPANLWKLGHMTQNHSFLRRILEVQISLNFAMLVYDKLNNGKIAPVDFNQFGVNFFNYMKFCISKKSTLNMIKMAELNHYLWKKLGNRVPEEIMIEDEKIQFENQLITFQLLPLLFIIRSHIEETQELFDAYIMKLFTISCEYTCRIAYTFRDVLFENPASAADLTYKSIHGIVSMQNVLNQDRAVIVFQAMMYTLKGFVIDEEDGTPHASGGTDADLLIKMPNVLYAVLVGLYTLVDRYNITWKESIETICLLNFTLTLLKNPNMTTRLAVQATKLAQLSIEHFLSPNLALLVENLNGSGMQNLGPIITKRLHDTEWEVRDSTLELVTAMTSISRLKFPPFQKYILDHGICPIVYSMAKHDMEPYVRASALKCLREMVIINLLWEHSLNQLDLMDHLLKSLYSESEGIVRKEIVYTITKIYDNRKIPQNKMNLIYSTLAYCVVNDLHWEVRLNALNFFKIVTIQQFSDQGMIDGTFPAVTFSKEYRKIVTLTEKEISNRIRKIFNELSRIGCLGVVLQCLNDDCDLEVVKAAVKMANRFLCALNGYDYRQILELSNETELKVTQSTSNPIRADNMECESEENSEVSNGYQNSENIIEFITKTPDLNLLVTAYENQMKVNASPMEKEIDENYYQVFAKISAADFFKQVNSMNINEMLETKCDWLQNTESFDSLLDDMLLSVGELNVNDIDCY